MQAQVPGNGRRKCVWRETRTRAGDLSAKGRIVRVCGFAGHMLSQPLHSAVAA